MWVREVEVVYKRGSSVKVGLQCTGPSATADILREWGICRNGQERFCVVYLDNRSRVKYIEEIARGSLNSVGVDLKALFRGVILKETASIVLAHNHPSGDCTPSDEDIALTIKIAQAGDMLDIKVLDHLVIVDDGYCSIVEGIVRGVERLANANDNNDTPAEMLKRLLSANDR
jgi:DNA repair protein RadC